MTLHSYVIYHDNQPQQLTDFLAQDRQAVFTPIAAVNEHSLGGLPSLDLVFDTAKYQANTHRLPTAHDIAHTLSHLKCYQAVSLNQNIADDEFVLIAEANITLAPNYRHALIEHIEHFLFASQYELVILQRNNDSYWQDKLYTGNGEISSIVYNGPSAYNKKGAGLYLIRKRQIQHILTKLHTIKPYWSADDFSELCDYTHIAQTNAMLGKVATTPYQKPDCPLFSLIVPIYNVESYLRQAIDSVLQQDFYNYEIILVNDGSTDSSGDIAYHYSKQYPHIQFVNQPNGGQSSARNTAINIAKGEYLMFLDSDDYWQGTSVLSDIAKLIAEHQQPDLVLHGFTSIYQNGHTESHQAQLHATKLPLAEHLKALVENYIYLANIWTKVVKTTLVKQVLYFPEGYRFEDTLWVFRLAKSVQTFAYYHSDFYQYRRTRAGATTQGLNPNNIADFLYIFEQCYQEIISVDRQSTLYAGLLILLKNYVTYMVEYISYLPQDVKDRYADAYADFEQKQQALLG